MSRIEKQARDILSDFIREELGDRKPKILNSYNFAHYIAKKNSYDLRIYTLSVANQHLRGQIARSTKEENKRALIFISASQNECWARFTVVKEACHMFLQHEKNIDADHALLMAQELVDFNDKASNKYYTEEISAIVAAAEIMIPASDWLKSELENNTLFNVAQKLKVPQKMLEYRAKNLFYV